MREKREKEEGELLLFTSWVSSHKSNATSAIVHDRRWKSSARELNIYSNLDSTFLRDVSAPARRNNGMVLKNNNGKLATAQRVPPRNFRLSPRC